MRTVPGRPSRLVRLGVGLGLVALLAGTLAASPLRGTEPTAQAATPRIAPAYDHVVVVMMENKNRTSVIGSDDAPYLNALAGRSANLTRSYGVTHPSQPNYIALFSGGQQGVTTNDCRDLGDVPNLATQLRAAGKTFVGYAESMPSTGFTGCAATSGRYQRKHNSWVSFSNVRASQNQPFSRFPTDYTKLPDVAFVTPDMCSDMHDCSVAHGDAWLKTHLDRYARWAVTHNSLLVVTWDENQGGTVNQIPTLLVGAKVRPGLYPEWTNHYTLLRTIEDSMGLPALGLAQDASPLRTVWTTAPKQLTGVRDGGFEGGGAGWADAGTVYPSTSVHHSGKQSIRVGSTRPRRGDSVVSQSVTVPQGRTRLTVWWTGRCRDTVAKAWTTVVVRRNTSGGVSTLLPRTCRNDTTWRKVSVAVTPGHSYTVQLVSHDDGAAGTPNRAYFDDVTLS